MDEIIMNIAKVLLKNIALCNYPFELKCAEASWGVLGD
jgi:hypothetical protein